MTTSDQKNNNTSWQVHSHHHNPYGVGAANALVKSRLYFTPSRNGATLVDIWSCLIFSVSQLLAAIVIMRQATEKLGCCSYGATKSVLGRRWGWMEGSENTGDQNSLLMCFFHKINHVPIVVIMAMKVLWC